MSESSHIKLAIYRCETYDIFEFERWLLLQPDKLVRTATTLPPNRIYEGPLSKLYYVRGYGKDGHVVLGFVEDDDGAVIHADPGELRDVTDELRRRFGLLK